MWQWKQRSGRERLSFEDAVLPALKMEEWAPAEEVRQPLSRSGKKQGSGFSRRVSRRRGAPTKTLI